MDERVPIPHRGNRLQRRSGNNTASSNSARSYEHDSMDYGVPADLRSLVNEYSESTISDASVTSEERARLIGWDAPMIQDRSRAFEEVGNKQMPPEELSHWMKKMEKHHEQPFTRTHLMGRPTQYMKAAPIPEVAIVFLPGADLPEVNRAEAANMMEKGRPDQRDALWRANSAASLLTEISVTKDLSLRTRDVTPDVCRNTVRRLKLLPPDVQQARQVERADNSEFGPKYAITIDSETVRVVGDFKSSDRNTVDLCATLIEVNVSSLASLMFDYKSIVANGGLKMRSQQLKDLLERMIEAARRFCYQSPVLFRMSTRPRIIDSTNTRYGYNSETGFQTFITSKGIMEIINQSSAFFTSLNKSTPGMDATTQDEIRPRFLQMLALLLSLLNDDDIDSMSEFLQQTYGLSPKRTDLELLFLRVIPLTSINSEVFLQALIPTVDEWPIPEEIKGQHSVIWTSLMKRLASKGYLLPASVESLGHTRCSWLPKWPDEGVQSSTAFGRLQYHAETRGTFNEVPAAQFRYETQVKELTVILTNDETYSIHPDDYESISTLTPGVYTVTRCQDSMTVNLEISEMLINKAINEAVRVINEAIRRHNLDANMASKSRAVSFFSRSSALPILFRDLESFARLTRNQATLDGNILAIAYKLDGRHVPKTGALRHMAGSSNRACTLIRRLVETAGRSAKHYAAQTEDIHRLLTADRQARDHEASRERLSDSPILHALNPVDSQNSRPPDWFSCRSGLQDGYLFIQAQRDYVQEVTWRKPGELAHIKLTRIPTILFVAPLNPLSESHQDDEVRVGDLVLLVGKYIVVAEVDGQDFNRGCVMLNWMEVKETIVEGQTSRRKTNADRTGQEPITWFK